MCRRDENLFPVKALQRLRVGRWLTLQPTFARIFNAYRAYLMHTFMREYRRYGLRVVLNLFSAPIPIRSGFNASLVAQSSLELALWYACAKNMRRMNKPTNRWTDGRTKDMPAGKTHIFHLIFPKYEKHIKIPAFPIPYVPARPPRHSNTVDSGGL